MSISKNQARKRVLHRWRVASYLANDPTINIYHLIGFTVKEADGFEPSCRITSTSPIVKCEGNIVTTASGSEYELTESTSNPAIAREYWDAWIDGDNWKTI